MINILLVATDPGARNPFLKIQEASLALKDINISFYDASTDLETSIKLNDFILVGTSEIMELEVTAFKYSEKYSKPTGLFVDENYNYIARFSPLYRKALSPNLIFSQEKIKIDKFFNNSKLLVSGNPSLDYTLSDTLNRFNYTYSPKGPLVIVDEFKNTFDINGLKDKFKNCFFSEIVLKTIDESFLNDFKIRSHPRNVSIDEKLNYISGKVRGFLGYSSIALAELALLGFNTTSIASPNIKSLSTQLVSKARLKNGRIENIRDLESSELKAFKSFHALSALRIINLIKTYLQSN